MLLTTIMEDSGGQTSPPNYWALTYEEAKAMYPERWHGRQTRNWDLPEEVCLNPDKVVQGDVISQESEALAS